MRVCLAFAVLLAVSLAFVSGARGVGCSNCLGPGAEDPVWLPAGQGIGYAATSTTSSRDVFIRRPDGTRTRLTHSVKVLSTEQHRPFAFSPDGSTLAFVDDDLQLIDVRSGSVTRHVPADFASIAFSSDGSGLAFERNGLWALDVASGATRLVAATGHHPAWRGRSIAFDASGIVYVSDGSTATAVARGARPVWSPDGQRLLYERNGTVWAERLDDHVEHPLDRGSTPRWLPDGTTVVYAGAFGEIGAVDAGGGTPRVLYNSEQIDRDPVPSPDGSQIAFVSDRAGEYGRNRERYGDIYLVPTSGGRRTALLDGCGIDARAPEQTVCLRRGGQSIPATIAVAPRLLITKADNSSKRRIVLGGYVLDRDGRAVRNAHLFAIYGPGERKYASADTLWNGRWVLALYRAGAGTVRTVRIAIGEEWIEVRVPQKSFG